jgi:hypothetical protein
MIVFNQQLIDNIDKKDTAKLLAFIINEEIDNFDDFPSQVNEVLQDMINNGDIVRSDTTRLVLTKPLYVLEHVIQQGNIQELRKLFSKYSCGTPGLMGNKEEVTVALNLFFKKNPTVTFDEVYNACKAYIQHCKFNNSYISKLHNFISKDLEVWVEDNVKTKDDESLLDKL